MTPAAEQDRPPPAPGGPLRARVGGHTHTAFGLELELDPQISIPGLAQAADGRGATHPEPVERGADSGARRPGSIACATNAALATPPTRVELDPAELRRRWAAIATTPTRVRTVDFGGTRIRTIDFAEPAGYLLWNRDHGRVLISPDGGELLCEPDPGNAQWTAIVAAQALPLAATLRGLEVLHASGVVLGGRAVLITGASGAGKSSLAAALLREGGLLLSDDAVALRLGGGELVAHAGSLALQLRAAEDERLSAAERAGLGHPAETVEDKRRYVSTVAPPPAPLIALLLLERSAAEPALQPLAAVSPFALLASTFNLSVRTPQRLRRQLDVVEAIAGGGLAHRLRVQPGVDATALAARVREYLAGPQVSGAEALAGRQVPGAPAPGGAQGEGQQLVEL